jgi:hypothetical protein
MLIADADAEMSKIKLIIPLDRLLVYSFATFVTLALPVWLAEVVLVYTQPVATSVVLQEPLFWSFNLLCVGIAMLGTIYICLFSPSARLLLYTLIVSTILFSLVAAWAYHVFGVLAMIIFATIALSFASATFLHRKIFMLVSRLPVEDLTMQVFFTIFRFLLLLLTPILVQYFSASTTMTSASPFNATSLSSSSLVGNQINPVFSEASFFAVVVYAMSAVYLVMALRTFAAIYPGSQAVVFLMRQHTTRQLAQHFVPFFLLVLVFGVIYVIVVSQSSTLVPTSVVIALLAVAYICMLLMVAEIFLFLSRVPQLAILNMYTNEDYEWLHAARARQRETHTEMTEFIKQRDRLENTADLTIQANFGGTLKLFFFFTQD